MGVEQVYVDAFTNAKEYEKKWAAWNKMTDAQKRVLIAEDNPEMLSTDADETESQLQQRQTITYQAASPDEVALVSWSETVGLTLIARDLHSMTLRLPNGTTRQYTILHVFPFTSETKRMGIIVKVKLHLNKLRLFD